MATVNSALTKTAVTMANGADGTAGVGENWYLTFGGTWAVGDTWSLVVSEPIAGSGYLTQLVGIGFATAKEPSFALTLNNRVHLAAGEELLFSALAEPTVFNNPNAIGNGYIVATNRLAQTEDIVALAPYQDKLAMLSRNNVQIWSIAADPMAFVQVQMLDNVGTFAPLSVQAVGTLDVMFLSDCGVRSLRVRDSSNNATVIDVGSPVDNLILTHLESLSEAEKAAACAVVDPANKMYWVFLPGNGDVTAAIYVLSYFPAVGVSAWGTFRATTSTGATFVPQKFAIKDGRVYARTSTGIIAYGGSDGVTYDASVASWALPWLSDKQPATRKILRALDAVYVGNWALTVAADFNVGASQIALTTDVAKIGTHESNSISLVGQGTHFQVAGSTAYAGKATISAVVVHYKKADAR